MYTPNIPTGKILGASTVAGSLAILPQTSGDSFLSWLNPEHAALFIIALLFAWGTTYLLLEKISNLWQKKSGE